MSDGKGCTCHAMGRFECCCDGVDWTPQELIDARNEIARLRFEIIKRDEYVKGAEKAVAPLYARIDELEKQVADRQRCGNCVKWDVCVEQCDATNDRTDRNDTCADWEMNK